MSDQTAGDEGGDVDERAALRGVVEEFFERMADDDRRSTVGELFADDATITVPGATFEGSDAADEMLAFFAPRYEWAAKEYDRWFVDERENAVVSLGTLYGVDNDGDEFSDVSYVDVYEIRDGEIDRLDIYNDLVADGVVPVGGASGVGDDATATGSGSEGANR
ncbi:nuclear transport factor 2 family protein [Halorubellus sp. JP-L1]|uniref:nuclear transport factor 2 family protein n=1 Tax=Halorubellus sp. JP-L1 TaxID=2715753 RepID=UPI00140DC819|nr:nuclear transport factor 2 family protein [Halorubellus sp. JP-L1]NHN42834.1 nuclear transport factor 2 family protein [Halorubellus sp. JP-L1]